MAIKTESLKLFYCYAREDKALRDELDLHLSPLKRQNYITSWSDYEISPGMEWSKEIENNLNTAHIILLLISPHFIASEYCYGIEMRKALERHEKGIVRVIPILLRVVDWEDAPFSKLQVLPSEGKPVTRWNDRDEAFWDITRGIRKAVQELQARLNIKENWLEEGRVLSELKRYEEALNAFNYAIQLDSTFAAAYEGKGRVLSDLKRYEEALNAFDHAIHLNPNSSSIFYNKSITLTHLTLQTLERAKQLGADISFLKNSVLNVQEDASKSVLKHIFMFDGNHNLSMSKTQSPGELFTNIDNCLFIELDKESIAAVNVNSYKSMSTLLDEVYFALIHTKYPAYTYGENWILASKNDGIKQIIAPWSWLLRPGRNKSIHDFDQKWLHFSLKSCGLIPGTHWQVVSIPSDVFGMVTNDYDLSNLVSSLSKSQETANRVQSILNDMMVASSGTVNIEDYKSHFIFTSFTMVPDGTVLIA